MRAKQPPPMGYNIIIIGSGATGALTAARLSKAGHRVTVLDREIGNNSSARSAACIRSQFTNPSTVKSMLFSKWAYANFSEFLDFHEEALENVYHKAGYLFLYEKPSFAPAGLSDEYLTAWENAKKYAVMQRSLGDEVYVYSPSEVAERWSHLDASRIIGATWGPTDGFLTPDLIYQYGLKAAKSRGAQVILGAWVTGADVEAGRITTVHTTKGDFQADIVINATNAWGRRTSALLGGANLLIEPCKRYLYFSKTQGVNVYPKDWASKQPMIIYGMAGNRMAYSRPEAGGSQFMMGKVQKVEPEPNFTHEDQDIVVEGFAFSDMPSYGHELLQDVCDFAPKFGETLALIRHSSGYYGETPDHNPIIDRDAIINNLYHACGFSGHGLMQAPSTAEAITAIIEESAKDCLFLPEPFYGQSVNLIPFKLQRDFNAHREGIQI